MAVALAAPMAALTAYGVDDVVKFVFAEPRPCQVIGGVTTVLPCDPPGDFSFPSNHSALAAAMAVGVLLLHRRLGVIAVLAALAMAASRVYVGAHYPHDVVMGLLVGGIVAVALCLAPAGRSRRSSGLSTSRCTWSTPTRRWCRHRLRDRPRVPARPGRERDLAAPAPVTSERIAGWTTGLSCRDRCWRWCWWCSWPLRRW